MAQYFSNLVLSPENLQSLRDAIIKKVLDDENIRRVLTIKRVRTGEPLAIIGEMDAVGHAGAGCNPTYEQIGIGDSLQRWALGAWEIALQICYKDFEGTMAEYALRAGTPIGDLTDTEIMAIYLELLETQMRRMLWRLAWFGDTTAQNITNGGVITDTEDVTLLTPNDGLFKRLFAIAAASPSQYTAISANSAASYAAQKSAMLAAGYATGIVDTIKLEASTKVNAGGEATLFMNKKFADYLAHDIKVSYKDNLPFERIFDGFYLAYYDGMPIVAIEAWDYLIDKYENTGVKWNLPFRAVLANPANLLLGVDKDDPISTPDVWFDKKDRMNYVYATGKIDTMVAQPDLVHVAY
jgi:hypothetical protein